MLISMCIPCHNRTHDLKKTMPSIIESANLSPPVEIVVLDYNSPDDLRDWFFRMSETTELTDGNFFTYRRYGARDYYHTSHANNLSVLASRGEYVVIGCTDMLLAEEYFAEIRKLLEEGGYVWLQSYAKINFIVCQKTEFVDAGGFDERFEFYGPNDKDFAERLERRGGRFTYYSHELITIIPTPWSEKTKNYRITSRREIGKLMKPIYLENQKNEVWTVNEEKGWGSWE